MIRNAYQFSTRLVKRNICQNGIFASHQNSHIGIDWFISELTGGDAS